MPVLLSPDCVQLPLTLTGALIGASPTTTARVIGSAAVPVVGGTSARIPVLGWLCVIYTVELAFKCVSVRLYTLYIHFMKCIFAHTCMYLSPSYYNSIIYLHSWQCAMQPRRTVFYNKVMWVFKANNKIFLRMT